MSEVCITTAYYSANAITLYDLSEKRPTATRSRSDSPYPPADAHCNTELARVHYAVSIDALEPRGVARRASTQERSAIPQHHSIPCQKSLIRCHMICCRKKLINVPGFDSDDAGRSPEPVVVGGWTRAHTRGTRRARRPRERGGGVRLEPSRRTLRNCSSAGRPRTVLGHHY